MENPIKILPKYLPLSSMQCFTCRRVKKCTNVCPERAHITVSQFQSCMFVPFFEKVRIKKYIQYFPFGKSATFVGLLLKRNKRYGFCFPSFYESKANHYPPAYISYEPIYENFPYFKIELHTQSIFAIFSDSSPPLP